METTTPHYPEERLRGRPGILRRAVRTSIELSDFITDALRDAIRRRRMRRALRAQREMLASLDDRTLHDIGLHRGEIDSLVSEMDAGQAATRRRAHPDSVSPLY